MLKKFCCDDYDAIWDLFVTKIILGLAWWNLCLIGLPEIINLSQHKQLTFV